MIFIHKGCDTGSRSDSPLRDLCIKSKEKKIKQIKNKIHRIWKSKLFLETLKWKIKTRKYYN